MLNFSFGKHVRFWTLPLAFCTAASFVTLSFAGQQNKISSLIVLNLNKSHSQIAPSISVINSKGVKLSTLVSIQDYNQETGNLSFEDVSGASIEIGISEFSKVIFGRNLKQQQVQVQQASYSTTELKKGDSLTLLIPRAELDLKNGLVKLNQKWVRPNSIALFAVQGTTRLEPISLEYNKREDKFVLSAQYIKFIRNYHEDAGGSSSGGKVIR